MAFAIGSAANSLAAINLTFYDANYVGRIHDAQPADPGDEAGYIKDLITLAAGDAVTEVNGRDYDRLFSTNAGPFDMPVEDGSFKDDTGATTVTLLATYKYVLGKYDGPNWGDEVWYFPDGITGEITLPAYPDGLTKWGLSHVSAYNQAAVPEASSLLVWGGLALTGLCLCRRKLVS